MADPARTNPATSHSEAVAFDRVARRRELQARWRRPLWLAAAFVVLSGLLAAALLTYQHGQTLAAGEHLTRAFATVVDEQTTRTVQTVDQQLQLVVQSLSSLDDAGALDEQSARALLREQLADLPYVRAVWVMGEDGRIVYDSDEGNIGQDLSDRDYFQVYKTRPQTGLYLGAPVRSRSLGNWFVSAARPLPPRNGRFAGIVVAAIEPPYFDRLWRAVALEAGGAVSLLRADGMMMLRSPPDDAAMGRNFAAGELFVRHLPVQAHGSFRARSSVDGTERVIAYQTLEAYPNLVVVVGNTVEAILAPWTALARTAGFAWALMSLVFIGLAWRIQHLANLQQRAEDSRDEMTQRLSLATDAARIVVWDWDLVDDLWFSTPTYYTTLGYPPRPGPVDHDGWIGLVHPDDRARATTLNTRMRSGDATRYDQELRMRHADDSYRWVQMSGRVQERDAHGRPLRLVGVRIDITSRKQAEIERRQMLDRITDGFVAFDREWRYTYVNERAGQLLERDPASLIGKVAWEEFPPRPDETFHLECQRAMAEQRSVKLEAFYPEFGRWIEDHIYPSPQGVSIYFRDVTERKVGEEALRRAKQHAEDLITGANALIVGFDAGGRINLFNHAAQALTGYSLADLQDQGWLDLVVPRTRFAQTWEIFRRLPEEGLPRRFEGPVCTRDGEERLISWQNSNVLEGGVLTGTLAFGIDITDQRRAEQALNDSKEQFETLAENSIQGILLLRGNHVAYVNPAMCRIVGRTRDELTGISVDAMQTWVHPEERAASQQRRERALRGKTVTADEEMRILHADGTWRWVQLATRTITIAGEPTLLVMVVDIHDRTLAEEALRNSEERFRLAFDSSAVGMSLTSLDGRWLKLNAAVSTIVGYTADDLRGMTFMDITHPEDLQADLANLTRMTAGEFPHFQMEKRLLHREGHVVWINLTVALIRDHHGEPLYTVAQFEDISQRKQLENELRTSQARLRATLDALPDLLFEVDREGRYHDYHSPRTDLLLRPPEELLGHNIADVMSESAVQTIMGGLQEAERNGFCRGRQIEIALPDRTRWFELTMSRKAKLPGEDQRFIVLSRDVTERWENQEALRRSDELMRQMAETVDQAFWLVDRASNRYLYVSPAFATVLGCSVADAYANAQAWRARIHADDRARVDAAVDSSHRTGIYKVEFRLNHPDGSLRWISGRSFPIRDAGGKIYRCTGVAQDITAQKQHELREQHEREMLQYLASSHTMAEVLERFVRGHEAMLPGAIGSVLLLDDDGVHVRHGAAPRLPAAYNQAIDGLPIGPCAGSCGTAAFTGKTVVVSDIALDPLWEPYRDTALAHGLRACWSVPIKGLSGKVLGTFAFYFTHVRSPQADELATIERGAHLASQAMERLRAVQALQQSEDRLRQLVEWAPIGIAVHQDWKFVYANPTCVAMLGARSETQLLGTPVLDRIPQEHHASVRDRVARILAGHTTPIIIRPYFRLDGSVIEVEGTGAPITINGRPAVQLSLRDVTEHNAAQAALLASREQLRVLSVKVLAAQETERRRVAHELHDELGQALTAIKINLQAEARSDGTDRDAARDENIRIVERTLQQVRSLALALRPSMLDDLGLVPALRWLTGHVAPDKTPKVHLHVTGMHERADSDLETAVFRIVQEAITNALRHAGASRIDVFLRRDGDDLMVQITDDGAGFDVAAMQQRALAGGSMGMLGMRERASLAGGSLHFDSAPGKGCSVSFHGRWRGATPTL